eukprot:02774.XXX_67246_67410_1 [CDS] Oithona nana genome sequencing.
MTRISTGLQNGLYTSSSSLSSSCFSKLMICTLLYVVLTDFQISYTVWCLSDNSD